MGCLVDMFKYERRMTAGIKLLSFVAIIFVANDANTGIEKSWLFLLLLSKIGHINRLKRKEKGEKWKTTT